MTYSDPILTARVRTDELHLAKTRLIFPFMPSVKKLGLGNGAKIAVGDGVF